MTLSYYELANIDPAQHDVEGAKHSITAAQYEVVCATAVDTLGTIIGSSNPGARVAYLMSDGSGDLTIGNNLTVTNNIILNGVEYDFPASGADDDPVTVLVPSALGPPISLEWQSLSDLINAMSSWVSVDEYILYTGEDGNKHALFPNWREVVGDPSGFTAWIPVPGSGTVYLSVYGVQYLSGGSTSFPDPATGDPGDVMLVDTDTDDDIVMEYHTPSSAPGAAAAILKSDASGYITLERLQLGNSAKWVTYSGAYLQLNAHTAGEINFQIAGTDEVSMSANAFWSEGGGQTLGRTADYWGDAYLGDSVYIGGSTTFVKKSTNDLRLGANTGGVVDLRVGGASKATMSSTELNVQGNITVTGTVDTVDIAAFKTAYDTHTHPVTTPTHTLNDNGTEHNVAGHHHGLNFAIDTDTVDGHYHTVTFVGGASPTHETDNTRHTHGLDTGYVTTAPS